jgi:hypothetical protein
MGDELNRLDVSDGDKNKGRNKREDNSGSDGAMAMDALTMSRLMKVMATRTMWLEQARE